MTSQDSGFTLVEVLVGLLVLSLSALALSTTLSSAFLSHTRIKGVTSVICQSSKVEDVLRKISRTEYLKAEQDPNGEFGELQFYLHDGRVLSVVHQSDTYFLKLFAAQDDPLGIKLYESVLPLRLKFLKLQSRGNRYTQTSNSVGKVMALEQRKDDIWENIAIAPIIVSVPPGCQYDIVGRRCR